MMARYPTAREVYGRLGVDEVVECLGLDRVGALFPHLPVDADGVVGDYLETGDMLRLGSALQEAGVVVAGLQTPVPEGHEAKPEYTSNGGGLVRIDVRTASTAEPPLG